MNAMGVFGFAILMRGLIPAGASAVMAQDTALELSCSTFPASLRSADLASRFGGENVVNGPVIGSDDGPVDGTILYAGVTDARLEIRWSPGPGGGPAWIKVTGEQSRWRTPNRITIGTDLLTLEKANGKPFRLYGFWKEGGLGGSVVSWSGGKLHSHDVAGCSLLIQLQPRYDGTEDVALMRQIRSGREYSSGHPAMQAVNPRVVGLWIIYRIASRHTAFAHGGVSGQFARKFEASQLGENAIGECPCHGSLTTILRSRPTW